MIVDGESDQIKGSNNSTNMNVIVRNLPERENENTMVEVNCLIKDGLEIRDITVESATRKSNYSAETNPGIVIAKFKSKYEKFTVMKNKNKLKDHRRFSNVFLEHDLPRHQRVVNAKNRTIVKHLVSKSLNLMGQELKFESCSDRAQKEQHRHTSVMSRDSGRNDDQRRERREARERPRSDKRYEGIQQGDVKKMILDEEMIRVDIREERTFIERRA